MDRAASMRIKATIAAQAKGPLKFRMNPPEMMQ
jgi:hypothetical protein